jgi:hypothetical protein
VSLLNVKSELPGEVLSARAADLRDLLGGPTLFHLPGRRPEPLFVSLLLHGNEDVGWLAVRNLLQAHQDRELPRALSLFVGNVFAAQVNQRRLDGQPDYNRIWPGADDDGTPEHAMMREVVSRLAAQRVFASIDLHNNTGRNPFYGCVRRTDDATLHLAALFSPTVVLFERPAGVQTGAFFPLCPAVTCECGKVGDSAGVERATEFLHAALHLAEFPHHPVPTGDLHLFHTVATVYVPAGTTFTFDGDSAADLRLTPEVDRWNFQECRAGTVWGRRRADSGANLLVRNLRNDDVTPDYLTIEGDAILLRRPVLPSMLTLNHRVIEQDCLCYFMERYPYRA